MSDREGDSREVLALVEAWRNVVGPAMERSPALRRAVGLLGAFLVEEARRAEVREPAASPPSDSAQASSDPPIAAAASEVVARQAASPASEDVQRPPSRGIVPLKIGDVTLPVRVSGTTEEIGRARASLEPGELARETPVAELDLGLVEARCVLKARSCELFVERDSLAGGDDERKRANYEAIGDVLRAAKATRECFLWVLWREREQPATDVVRRIGRCYRALAAAVGVMRRVDESSARAGDGLAAEAMALMAEATSALRVALRDTWLTVADRDQDDAHLWLRRETAWRQVFLERYMSLSDPADPDRAEGVIDEARELSDRLAKRVLSAKSIDSALSKLRYHAAKAAGGDTEHFERVVESLGSLRSMGLSSGDRRLREAISPATIAAMPEALREHPDAHWFAETILKPAEVTAPEVKERAWSARVTEARQLVENRMLVIVGGEPRNDAIDRLERAFGLSRLEWVFLSEHGSSDALRAPIERAETAAVLVLIKLTGHLHAEDAQRYARAAGKPCVYLTAGYNPEQVAEALLQQAGERLRERLATAAKPTSITERR